LGATALVSKECLAVALSDRLWLHMLKIRWPHIDWKWRADHLQKVVGLVEPFPANKLLYAQQLSLSLQKGNYNVTRNTLYAHHMSTGAPKENRYYRMKWALLGNRKVGKSSFAMKVCYRVDVAEKAYPKPDHCGGILWNTCYFSPNGRSFNLSIYEANKDSKDSIQQALSGCNAVILTFDRTQKETFTSLSEWDTILSNNSIPTILVGLKADLPSFIDQNEDICVKNKYCFSCSFSIFGNCAAIVDKIVSTALSLPLTSGGRKA